MHRPALLAIFLFGLAVCFLQNASAQASPEKPTLTVGIASPGNLTREVFNAGWARDQMVRDINNEATRDKKAAVKIHAVPLDGTTMDDVAEQLRDQNCQYVVLTSASEQIGVAGYDSAPGIPNPMKQAPDNSPGAAKVLGVKYSINRVGQPGTLSHGSILAEGTGDGFGQSAIDQAFRNVATRVSHEILKMKPAPIN
jgi:hypothetical protein